MKKLHYLIFSLAAVLGLSLSSVVFAVQTTKEGFEFSIDELSQEIAERIGNGEDNFTIAKEIMTSDPDMGNQINVCIWVTRDTNRFRTARATDTVNWALSGRYYFKSSDETVSNYGNHGNVDFNGSSLSNAQWDVYHDVTHKYSDKYTATASDSTTTVTDRKKFAGKYRLKNKSTGNYSDDAEIYIIVKKDGSWSTKGNYSAINID